MFASHGNHQLRKVVSRYPHWQAMEVDALKCPLGNLNCCYTNPPWSVIGKWLHRLRENKHATSVNVAVVSETFFRVQNAQKSLKALLYLGRLPPPQGGGALLILLFLLPGSCKSKLGGGVPPLCRALFR